MPFGNCRKALSRRDLLRIARRFNAGNDEKTEFRPEGTVEPRRSGVSTSGDSAVPSGLIRLPTAHPALKRWATVACPSGTKSSRNSRKALVTWSQNDAHLAQHFFEHHDSILCSCGFDHPLKNVGV